LKLLLILGESNEGEGSGEGDRLDDDPGESMGDNMGESATDKYGDLTPLLLLLLKAEGRGDAGERLKEGGSGSSTTICGGEGGEGSVNNVDIEGSFGWRCLFIMYSIK
jgi:hypothetical protein